MNKISKALIQMKKKLMITLLAANWTTNGLSWSFVVNSESLALAEAANASARIMGVKHKWVPYFRTNCRNALQKKYVVKKHNYISVQNNFLMQIFESWELREKSTLANPTFNRKQTYLRMYLQLWVSDHRGADKHRSNSIFLAKLGVRVLLSVTLPIFFSIVH